jgi:ankyrin repeat protein
MDHETPKPKGGTKTIVFAVLLTLANVVAAVFAAVMLAWAVAELQYQGERWGLIGVLLFGGLAMPVMLLLLVLSTVLAAVRARKLRWWGLLLLLLPIIAAVGLDAAALAVVFYEPAQSAREFKQAHAVHSSGLAEAVRAGDTERVSAILDRQRGLLWETTYTGDTPLLLAARGSDGEMVELLLSRGADPNASHYSGVTPLHVAAERGDTDVARMLLDAGARVNAEDANRRTPLWVAQRAGSTEVVRFLKSRGATAVNYEAEAVRAAEQGNLQQLRQLLDRGVDVNAKVPNGCTLLHFAAERGDLDMARYLLSRGADLHARAGIGTPLHVAANEGRPEMVRFLVGRGADVNATRSEGITPLHWACDKGHLETVRALLEAGADTTMQSKWGRIPLEQARRSGHTRIVELIRQHISQNGPATATAPVR